MRLLSKEFKPESSSLGDGGSGGGSIGKQRNVRTVIAQAKAVELQRSEAALREWLEKEHAREASATEARTPRGV